MVPVAETENAGGRIRKLPARPNASFPQPFPRARLTVRQRRAINSTDKS